MSGFFISFTVCLSHYLNKDGEYIGNTNPLFGKEYLEPIQSRKGTEWHFKQLGKIDDV